jgi:2-dehydro-3-deoxygluconokinase
MFRELLLHFAPDSEGNWLNEQSLKMYVGGAEYNVQQHFPSGRIL